eukprot:5654549-Prymnesium_polylepis.1
MPPLDQKRPPGVRGHQHSPALPAAQPGRAPAAPVSLQFKAILLPGCPRRVRGVHNVETAKAGSIFKLELLTSP